MDVHLVPANFALGCESVPLDSLTCEQLNPSGNSENAQFAFLMLTGVPSILSLQIGISYPPSVDVLSWNSCLGAENLSAGTWPASGSGLTVAWPEGASPVRSDGVICAGYLVIGAGSLGTIAVTAHPETRSATCIDAESATLHVALTQRGVANAWITRTIGRIR